MALKKIDVRIPAAEDLVYYRRAGLCFTRGVSNIVEVDEKQLAALRADPLIAIGEPPPAEKPAK